MTKKTSFQSMGGHTRAANLSPERRSQIARDAAKKRWQHFRAYEAAGVPPIPTTPHDKMLYALAEAKSNLELAKVCVRYCEKLVAKIDQLLRDNTT